VEAAQLPWIPLGELLVQRGLLAREQLEEALRERVSGQRIGEIIVERGWVTASAIAHALAEQYGFPFMTLDHEELDLKVSTLLPETLARRYEALPVRFLSDNVLLVAVTDPANVLASDAIRLALGHTLQLAVVSEPDLGRALNRAFRHEIQIAVDEGAAEEYLEEAEHELTDSGSGVPTINLVNALLRRAIEDGASDLHFEPQQKRMVVRARIDGVTRSVLSIPKHMQAGVISRLKVMGGLDIAERRLPQDGRVSVRIGGMPIDVRVGILPTTHGEQTVLRIFHRGIRRFDLSELGMFDQAAARFERSIRQPYGGVIVCGPTGSGKTTSLYAALDALNVEGRVLQTIEDPVEYQIDGINQIEVNPKAGLTFARGLRALLRADPDVILVGEIRDEETAKIASQAALTGHLVLSSLHAHSAAGSIERLKNMGVEPGLLATSLNCVVGQRLARRLCLSCRELYTATAEELEVLGLGDGEVELYRAKGCAECTKTGYSGRVALYEVMMVDGQVRRMIERSTEEIYAAAIEQGMTTMREEGVRLCLEGTSSFEEIRRVTGDRVG